MEYVDIKSLPLKLNTSLGFSFSVELLGSLFTFCKGFFLLSDGPAEHAKEEELNLKGKRNKWKLKIVQ